MARVTFTSVQTSNPTELTAVVAYHTARLVP